MTDLGVAMNEPTDEQTPGPLQAAATTLLALMEHAADSLFKASIGEVSDPGCRVPGDHPWSSWERMLAQLDAATREYAEEVNMAWRHPAVATAVEARPPGLVNAVYSQSEWRDNDQLQFTLTAVEASMWRIQEVRDVARVHGL